MVQDNYLVGDIIGNGRRIVERANAAREQGADLAVFPELALVGYPPEDLLYRPGFIAQSEAMLRQLLQDLRGIDVLIGLPRSSELRFVDMTC